MNTLVDSSVWIEFFKGNQKYVFMQELIDMNAICTNDLVLTELLPSISLKKERELAELLCTIKRYSLDIDWQEIQNIQFLNLKRGNNGIGIPDIIIAQNCMQNGLKLLTHDRHFAAMAKYIPLEMYT